MAKSWCRTYLVFFKEWSADVTIERVGKEFSQIEESLLQVICLLGILDSVDEEIYKPGLESKDINQHSDLFNTQEHDNRFSIKNTVTSNI